MSNKLSPAEAPTPTPSFDALAVEPQSGPLTRDYLAHRNGSDVILFGEPKPRARVDRKAELMSGLTAGEIVPNALAWHGLNAVLVDKPAGVFGEKDARIQDLLSAQRSVRRNETIRALTGVTLGGATGAAVFAGPLWLLSLVGGAEVTRRVDEEIRHLGKRAQQRVADLTGTGGVALNTITHKRVTYNQRPQAVVRRQRPGAPVTAKAS